MMYNYYAFMFDLLSETQNEISATYIIVSVAIFLFVFLIGFYFSWNSIERKHKDRIKSKSNVINIYVIDIKNDVVNYFATSKLRGRKRISVTSFYSQFLSKDRDKLITWIGDLLDQNPEVKNHIEVTIEEKNGKRQIAFLQVKKIDYNKELIYLDSHLLNYNIADSRKNKEAAYLSRDAFIKSLRQHNAMGSSICFSFFNKANKTNGLNHLAYLELKTIICIDSSIMIYS